MKTVVMLVIVHKLLLLIHNVLDHLTVNPVSVKQMLMVKLIIIVWLVEQPVLFAQILPVPPVMILPVPEVTISIVPIVTNVLTQTVLLAQLPPLLVPLVSVLSTLQSVEPTVPPVPEIVHCVQKLPLPPTELLPTYTPVLNVKLIMSLKPDHAKHVPPIVHLALLTKKPAPPVPMNSTPNHLLVINVLITVPFVLPPLSVPLVLKDGP